MSKRIRLLCLGVVLLVAQSCELSRDDLFSRTIDDRNDDVERFKQTSEALGLVGMAQGQLDEAPSEDTDGYPLTEEFDSDADFTSTHPAVYIQDGNAHWTIRLSTGEQYLYRSIPPFSGDVRLTVTGQVDSHQYNCYGNIGIGDGVADGNHVALRYGYTGAGCPVQRFRIHAMGVDVPVESDGCSPTGSLWVRSGAQYTSVLTITDGRVTLEVEGVGSLDGTPVYDGEYNTLYVGYTGPAASDPGQCSGSTERVIIEPLVR